MKKTKFMSLLIAIALVVAMLAGCSGGNGGDVVDEPAPAPEPAASEPADEPATDDGTVYKFNVSFAAPEFSCEGITETLDRIQENSNGRIEFTYYYSWSLTSVPTCVDDINAGVVDICAVPVNEHLNLFPYSNLVTYTPFIGLPDQLSAGRIYDELYLEHDVFAQEYAKNGLVYWANYPCPGYNIFTNKDFAIRTPGDLNGKKIITSSRMMQEFISANGGAPVGAPVTEYATSLNTGAVDGVVNHINVLRAFGALDFIEAATIFGEEGTAVSLLMMCFSEQAWNSLPADLQQLFKDEAAALREAQGGWDFGAAQGNLGAIKGEGAAVIELTNDEIQVWKDAFAEQLDGYIDELAGSGAPDARAIYDAVQAKIAQY